MSFSEHVLATIITSIIALILADILARYRVRIEQTRNERSQYRTAIYSEKLAMYRELFQTYRELTMHFNTIEEYKKSSKTLEEIFAAIKNTTIATFNLSIKYSSVVPDDLYPLLFDHLDPILQANHLNDFDYKNIDFFEHYYKLREFARAEFGSERFSSETKRIIEEYSKT